MIPFIAWVARQYKAEGRILLFRIAGPMSFGAAKGTARRLAAFDQYDVLVLDLTDVPQIDYTSARALEDMIAGTRDSNREVLLAGYNANICNNLLRLNILEQIGESQIKETRLEALQRALALVKEHS